jgi:hypothetical protein
MKTRGAAPGNIPFSIDVKGGEIETLMRSDGQRGSMSMVFPCLSVSINVGVSINAKGGDCWTIGLDSWLSLMSTLGEVRKP